MYHKKFKEDALSFFERARALIALNMDWYVGYYLSYIKIWGSNTVHMLPRIVPDRMVLQDFFFQTVIDGFFSKLAQHKTKAWPKFPLSLDPLFL